MSDLDTLFPDREVTVKPINAERQAVTVRPFFFGQLPKAVKLLRPVTDAIRSAGIAGFDGKDFSLAGDWALRLPQLMDEAGESLIEFVAYAIGKPRAWMDSLPADDGIALTKAVFEANSSFFVQRIAPLIGMAVTPKEAGAPSSPDSSLPATAETKLAA